MGEDRQKLVDAKGLLEVLFEPECRSSLRWVRNQQAVKTIPYLKIGHLIIFDFEEVLESLSKSCKVYRR